MRSGCPRPTAADGDVPWPTGGFLQGRNLPVSTRPVSPFPEPDAGGLGATLEVRVRRRCQPKACRGKVLYMVTDVAYGTRDNAGIDRWLPVGSPAAGLTDRRAGAVLILGSSQSPESDDR